MNIENRYSLNKNTTQIIKTQAQYFTLRLAQNLKVKEEKRLITGLKGIVYRIYRIFTSVTSESTLQNMQNYLSTRLSAFPPPLSNISRLESLSQ